MALDALVDSFLSQSEKRCGTERVNVSCLPLLRYNMHIFNLRSKTDE